MMTFLVFEEFATGDVRALRPTGERFRLAGYNLLYRAWQEQGSPVNKGWHVTGDQLSNLHFDQRPRPSNARLVIDFHPTATGRIGLIEPRDIFAYSFGRDGKIIWTPLMLRLRDVFYAEYDEMLTPENRSAILERVPIDFDGEEIIEFLYLNGDEKGWNWGRNGGTNAAFLHAEARDYFRQFF